MFASNDFAEFGGKNAPGDLHRAGLLAVFLKKSVYAAGGVIGVFRHSSWLFKESKWPTMGVRGSSEGRGENGPLEVWVVLILRVGVDIFVV